MTEEERRKLGEKRRNIFINVANGVGLPHIMTNFRCSEAEVELAVAFVAKKIKEYRFRRMTEGSPHGAPVIACDTWFDIRFNRLALLDTLRKLGDLYLSSDLLLPKITVQKIDSAEMLNEAQHRMRQ